MKRLFYLAIGLLIGIPLTLPLFASALSTYQVYQGGTGSTTLSGILIGNGTSAVNTLTVGSNLTLTGTTLSAAGGSGVFPFTSNVNFNSTTTPVGFLGGSFSNSSTTLNGTINFPGIISNVLTTNSSGVVTGVAAVPTSLGGTGLVNPGSLSANALLQFGGSGGASALGVGADDTIVKSTGGGANFTVGSLNLASSNAVGTSILAYANGGTGTTTKVQGQLRYMGATADQAVATTSAICSGTVSCSAFTVLGTSPITLAGSGVISGSCTGGTTCSGTNPLAINSFPWEWTLTNVFGTANANSTSTLTQFTGGITASSTVNFGNAMGAPFVWNSTVGGLSIGTTTNFWPLFLASSTVPQLALGNANASKIWQFMVQNDSSFVLSTSTVASPFSTSTPAIFSITSNGQVSLLEAAVATSTAMTIDWNLTPNQVDVQISASAMTIGFNNASTSGMTKRIIVCNGNSVASTVTWGGLGILWSGSAAPTQTTTANKCDTYSFIVTQGTSTVPSTTKVLGSYLQNF